MTAPAASRPVARGHRVTTVHTCQQGHDCLRCAIDADVTANRREDT